MAVILRDCNLFIHIPRCGGSYTIEVLKALGLVRLRMYDNPHVTPSFFQYYQNIFRFAFVRHPFEWLKSYYRLKRATARHPAIWLDNMIDSTTDFKSWIHKIYSHKPQVVGDYMYPYIGKGTSRIEFVGKYENLKEDLKLAITKGNLLNNHDKYTVDDVMRPKSCTQFAFDIDDTMEEFIIEREVDLMSEFYQ